MLANIRGHSIPEATDALLSLTYGDPDRAYIEHVLLTTIADSNIDVQVRSLAVTCLGHLARIYGEINTQAVLPVLRELKQSAAFGGLAQDVIEDIEIYVLRSK
ncbi:hypothetical protein GT755_02995 [Herbidospora sp. NEAU-GS84]|uniref:HEAT repeat domain-containing protein n=1 Tax=Herbidospora solisilvae TaxID=2696284 RepID=A0A7C9MYR4_9ACTN|nr:hypothetical protein [Herbidospora solisilvae]NAS20649.1 hypothetical protein [Herbidospora solisilvae]